MGLFDKLFGGVSDKDIVAVGSGTLVEPAKIKDDMFAQEMMGQTVGFELTGDVVDVVSPANGTLEVVFPTGHAFALRTADNRGLLVHIGIDTVKMEGKGFTILKKQGDKVKAGEPVVKVDLNAIKAAGYESTTMLVVTEGEKIAYNGFGPVEVGKKIGK